MRKFCEEYEALDERIVSVREMLDKEVSAKAFIKNDIDGLMREVEDESRRIVEEGEAYTPPDGPPALVKLSFALQELYTRKVSQKLLETELARLTSIMEATHKQSEEHKME